MKRKIIYLAVLLALLVLQTIRSSASAAEYRMETGLTVSEEYNDNVFLTPQNPTTDYITRLVPSLHAVYNAPLWEWDFAYALDFRYYAEGSKKHDSTQAITLANHTSLVPETFFLDVKDEYRRVSLDTVRDFTQQSLFYNQTDENQFIVAPYAHYRLGSHTTGTAGYQYRNVWYREMNAINKSEHMVYTEMNDELSARTVLIGGLRYVREQSNPLTYDRTDVYAGPRYEFAEASTLWLILGNSWFESEQLGRDTQGFWDAGLTYTVLTYAFTVNAALSYVDDPQRVQRREDRYTATFRKEGDRLSLGATAGRWEYRNVLTKHLQETRYGLMGTFGYKITPELRGSYALNIDRYEDNERDTFSMVYLNAVRLEYLFPANTTLAFDYRFDHGYSPNIVNYALNYDNNRFVVEIKKIF